MIGSLGVPELIFILILVLLVFGPKRLPEIGRTVGKGLAEFRKASNDLKRTINAELALDEENQPPRLPPARIEPARTEARADVEAQMALEPAAPTPAAVPAEPVVATVAAAPADAAAAPGSPDPGTPPDHPVETAAVESSSSRPIEPT